ncbi:MAG: hypothetical protein E2O89_02705 [Alphaproteobacteria bacterium]|nr:MAG: hypothetical protein E2O89_02705 [Alphaproteobacteria bacterium]
MGRGFYNSPIAFGSMAHSFCAQVAEVEVDPETGVVKVLKVTVAHDRRHHVRHCQCRSECTGRHDAANTYDALARFAGDQAERSERRISQLSAWSGSPI